MFLLLVSVSFQLFISPRLCNTQGYTVEETLRQLQGEWMELYRQEYISNIIDKSFLNLDCEETNFTTRNEGIPFILARADLLDQEGRERSLRSLWASYQLLQNASHFLPPSALDVSTVSITDAGGVYYAANLYDRESCHKITNDVNLKPGTFDPRREKIYVRTTSSPKLVIILNLVNKTSPNYLSAVRAIQYALTYTLDSDLDHVALISPETVSKRTSSLDNNNTNTTSSSLFDLVYQASAQVITNLKASLDGGIDGDLARGSEGVVDRWLNLTQLKDVLIGLDNSSCYSALLVFVERDITNDLFEMFLEVDRLNPSLQSFFFETGHNHSHQPPDFSGGSAGGGAYGSGVSGGAGGTDGSAGGGAYSSGVSGGAGDTDSSAGAYGSGVSGGAGGTDGSAGGGAYSSGVSGGAGGTDGSAGGGAYSSGVSGGAGDTDSSAGAYGSGVSGGAGGTDGSASVASGGAYGSGVSGGAGDTDGSAGAGGKYASGGAGVTGSGAASNDGGTESGAYSSGLSSGGGYEGPGFLNLDSLTCMVKAVFYRAGEGMEEEEEEVDGEEEEEDGEEENRLSRKIQIYLSYLASTACHSPSPITWLQDPSNSPRGGACVGIYDKVSTRDGEGVAVIMGTLCLEKVLTEEEQSSNANVTCRNTRALDLNQHFALRQAYQHDTASPHIHTPQCSESNKTTESSLRSRPARDLVNEVESSLVQFREEMENAYRNFFVDGTCSVDSLLSEDSCSGDLYITPSIERYSGCGLNTSASFLYNRSDTVGQNLMTSPDALSPRLCAVKALNEMWHTSSLIQNQHILWGYYGDSLYGFLNHYPYTDCGCNNTEFGESMDSDPRYKEWYQSTISNPKMISLVIHVTQRESFESMRAGTLEFLNTLTRRDLVLIHFDTSLSGLQFFREAIDGTRQELRERITGAEFEDFVSGDGGGSSSGNGGGELNETISTVFREFDYEIARRHPEREHDHMIMLLYTDAPLREEIASLIAEKRLEIPSIDVFTYTFGNFDAPVSREIACSSGGEWFQIRSRTEIGEFNHLIPLYLKFYSLTMVPEERDHVVTWIDVGEDVLTRQDMIAACVPVLGLDEDVGGGSFLLGVTCLDIAMDSFSDGEKVLKTLLNSSRYQYSSQINLAESIRESLRQEKCTNTDLVGDVGGETSTGTPALGMPSTTGTPALGTSSTTGTPALGTSSTTGTPALGTPSSPVQDTATYSSVSTPYFSNSPPFEGSQSSSNIQSTSSENTPRMSSIASHSAPQSPGTPSQGAPPSPSLSLTIVIPPQNPSTTQVPPLSSMDSSLPSLVTHSPSPSPSPPPRPPISSSTEGTTPTARIRKMISTSHVIAIVIAAFTLVCCVFCMCYVTGVLCSKKKRIRDQLAKRLEEEGDNFGTDYERLHENLVKSKEEEENL